MSNVIEFRRRGRSRGDSARMTTVESARGSGSIILSTKPGEDESSMQINGVYAERLQYGLFTIIKAASAMASKIAESGDVGYCSVGQVNDPLPKPTRRLPRRCSESTGFGGL